MKNINLPITQKLEPEKFFLIGNNLSLDFINTEIIENGEPKDLLAAPEDLAAWAWATKLIDEIKAQNLAQSWNEPQHESQFGEIKDFRKMLRRAVEQTARGETLIGETLEKINAALRGKNGFVEIARAASGFEKVFRAEFSQPRNLLAPVAESWADLLCYGDPVFLRKCENPLCILYFYDTTKNHRRRWCSMAGCGNRAKAAAFYRRQREQVKL